MQNILLVRPSFPPSRNVLFNISIGLCKIASYHKSKGDMVFYVEGNILQDNIPYKEIDTVYVTTMFTYYAQYAIDAINFYKVLCPNAEIIAGGILASISPDYLKQNSNVDKVIVGVIPEAEACLPDYSILPMHDENMNNTQILWASRGCKRYCDHCFVHVIEPELYFKSVDDIKKEMLHFRNRKNILFYDNSLAQHSEFERLLNMLKIWHKNYKFIYNAVQGLDGRMLKQWKEKEVDVFQLIRDCGFYDLRFSYDWSHQKESVYYCITEFEKVGYKRKDLQIYVIINTKELPEVIEKRYFEIYSLGCQIHSDLFKPSNLFTDKSDIISTEYGWTEQICKNLIRLQSSLNYATRMGVLYASVEDILKSKDLNVGKSSHKLAEYL